MNPWISTLRRHRVVRASALAIFLFGFAGAATVPYQALVGIQELGLSDSQYALIALCSSIANVILSIGFGLWSDRFQSYRRPLIFVSSFGILGFGMIWAAPSALSFTIAMIGPLALFYATNSMLFGNVRAHIASFDPAEADVVNALMRMMISLSWVLVPGAVGLALVGQPSMIGAWAIAAVLSAACLCTIIFGLEPDNPRPRPPELSPEAAAIPTGGTGTSALAPTAGRADRPVQVRAAGASLSGIAQILHPAILSKVLGVALISQVLHVNSAVMPLILTGQAAGEADNVGLIVGMVAVLEVIFMFYWASATRRISVVKALMITSALYLVYLVAIAFSTAVWQIWVASVVAGFAAAGIISLPISYLLDLICDRPGLSASLIAVNMFLGGAIGAGVFALGTWIGGYPAASVLAGVAGVLGAGLLIVQEKRA
ncbi:MFS transporter [Xinfangfangia sp. D13-10-4-6]|uniref:MFS transporter n=1 Tax=Pseudogemmobacter hezensis TaxID=2737662 RepID=UPI00155506A0|nr:MFS transporter [Pseudogemmobacter hezensis]NPD16019.1 MFS transporter [Pseudogemmobacter hezensis]